MGLSKAFDYVNRNTLRATLFKAGLPIRTIKNIQQGSQGAKLHCKDNGTYGEPVINNVGVFQGSALSALLFIIYLDDITQDHQILNDRMHRPRRYFLQPKEAARAKQLIQYIARTTKPETATQLENRKRKQQLQNSTCKKRWEGKTHIYMQTTRT